MAAPPVRRQKLTGALSVTASGSNGNGSGRNGIGGPGKRRGQNGNVAHTVSGSTGQQQRMAFCHRWATRRHLSVSFAQNTGAIRAGRRCDH